MKTIIFIFLIQTFLVIVSSDPDYYWKDFKGIIPSDAYVAGTNKGGQRVYIGNVHIRNHGLFVGPIYEGQNFVTVSGDPHATVYERTENVKILCTQSDHRFQWISTTYKDFTQIPYHLVEGGHERYENGTLYIGGIVDKKTTQVKIGKVIGYVDENLGIMYYADKDEQKNVNSYNILVYDE